MLDHAILLVSVSTGQAMLNAMLAEVRREGKKFTTAVSLNALKFGSKLAFKRNMQTLEYKRDI